MEMALQKAHEAKENNEVPVGAVIVHKNEVIARAHNLTNSQCDPTAHAEIIVLRKAAEILENSRLNECDLYVTLEPCTMCVGAISHARIRRLYYGAQDKKGGAVENGIQFFDNKTCMHKPEIYGGFNQTEAEKLLKEFFLDKR